jgi:hypothetical protein
MMRAFVDRMYGRVIFMGDKVYSMPISRVASHPELLKVPSYLDGNTVALEELIGSPSVQPQQPSNLSSSVMKDYLVSAKSGCLILSKLEPELRFNGRGDGKSISHIKSVYGDIPPQLQALIASGKVIAVSGAELKEIREDLARVEGERKALEESRRRSARGVRRREGVDDASDDDGESPIKNAVSIRL